MAQPEEIIIREDPSEDLITIFSNEVIDTTEMDCPICYEAFEDGVDVMAFVCGEVNHVVCWECYELLVDAHTDDCPMCRTPATKLMACTSKKFPKPANTPETAIMVD